MATEPGGTKPTPDPTVLTTEQLLREVERVRDLLHAELKGLQDTVDEKFLSVKEKFALVERQRVEQKEDTTRAVDAAFSAAKEGITLQTTASERAIAKSEASMLEQLKQLSTTFTTAINGVTVSVSDLKDRVTNIESVKVGGQEKLTSIYALVGFILTVLVIVGIVAASGGFK